MKIKKIKLENFKRFECLEMNLMNKFSVIIGQNNIGKTSIFEALHLWKKCYDLYLTSKKDSFYKKQQRYFNFVELDFMRIQDDSDLFTSGREAKLTVEFEFDNECFSLGFTVIKPDSIPNSYYRCLKNNDNEFERFKLKVQEHNIRLDKIISIYQSNPVSKVLKKEPFMNKGQINSKIMKGKSNEVLRNKIITNYSTTDRIEQLGNRVSCVLGRETTFSFKNKSRDEEYICLNVCTGEREFELYNQGSGLLQVSEIFATISYMDARINLILVDEPDSHIHEKLQKNLFNELKSIDECNVIVISHSDSFLSEVGENELFYLTDEYCCGQVLNPIQVNDFDVIKKELGGTIMALEKMSNSSKIVFVEGDDDIGYIEKITNKFITFCNDNASINNVYLFLRGKDYITIKLPNYVRISRQLNGRNIGLVTIFDKDFSTEETNNELKRQIMRITGNNSSVFTHDGYCFESVLFSDRRKLLRFIKKYTDDVNVDSYVESYFNELKSQFLNIDSDEFIDLNRKFLSQKSNPESRPELTTVEFNDFIREATSHNGMKIQYLANKKNLRIFFEEIQQNFSFNIIASTLDDNKDSTYVTAIFNAYIDGIANEEDIFDSLTEMCSVLSN